MRRGQGVLLAFVAGMVMAALGEVVGVWMMVGAGIFGALSRER